jgi:histidinol-phosphate aminotransferase
MGIAVRRGDTFPGLGPEHWRTAVRDRASSERLVAALWALLAAF